MLSNMCENSYIAQPNTSNPLPQIIDITDEMREVIVIHDEVHCNITLRAFKAPIVIPKRIHHVTMESHEPRLLVILNEDHHLVANNGAAVEEDGSESNIIYKILNRVFGNRLNVIFTADEGGLIRNPGASETMIDQLNPRHQLTEERTDNEDTSHHQRHQNDDNDRQNKAVSEVNESKEVHIVIPEIRITDSELIQSRSDLVISRGDLASVSRLSMPARLSSREELSNNLTKPAIAKESSNQSTNVLPVVCRPKTSFGATQRNTSAIEIERDHQGRDLISGSAGMAKRETVRGQMEDNIPHDFKEQVTHKSSFDSMRLQVSTVKRERSKREVKGHLVTRDTVQDVHQLTLCVPSIGIASNEHKIIRDNSQSKRKDPDVKNEGSKDSDRVYHYSESDEEKRLKEKETIEHYHFLEQKELKPIKQIPPSPMPAVTKEEHKDEKPKLTKEHKTDKIQAKVSLPSNKAGEQQKPRKTEGTEQASRKKQGHREKETGTSEALTEGHVAQGKGEGGEKSEEPTSASKLQSTYRHTVNRKRTSAKARKIVHKPKPK